MSTPLPADPTLIWADMPTAHQARLLNSDNADPLALVCWVAGVVFGDHPRRAVLVAGEMPRTTLPTSSGSLTLAVQQHYIDGGAWEIITLIPGEVQRNDLRFDALHEPTLAALRMAQRPS